MYINPPKDIQKYASENLKNHFVFYRRNAKGIYECYCTNCKKVHRYKSAKDFNSIRQENMCCNSAYYIKPARVCPECNHTVEYKSASYEQKNVQTEERNIGYFVKTDDGVDLNVVRVYSDYSSFGGDFKRKPKLTYDNFIVYSFTSKKARLFRDEAHNMGGRAKFYGGMREMRKFTSYESFNIFTKSMKAFAESALGGYNNLLMQFVRISNGSSLDEIVPLFLNSIIKYPTLKHLFKLGFCKLVYDHVKYSIKGFVNFKGKTVLKVLKCELSQLKKFDINKLTDGDIEAIHNMVEDEAPLTKVSLDIYKHYSYKQLREIVSKYCKINELVKYMTRQNASVSDYLDYTRECETLTYDLNDRHILFPKSLSEAHARTIAAVQYKTDKPKWDKFIKSAEKWLKCDYEGGGYSIKCLADPGQLVACKCQSKM